MFKPIYLVRPRGMRIRGWLVLSWSVIMSDRVVISRALLLVKGSVGMVFHIGTFIGSSSITD